MTHADVRGRLRAYADGTLADGEVEIVRAHLASGCVDCLREVFTRPVGLVRPPIVVRRTSRGLIGTVAFVGGLGLVLGALAVTGRWRGSGDDDAAVRSLGEEVARLRAERESAQAGTRADFARLEARIAQTERRATEDTPKDAARVSDSEGVPGWLDELLASDGTRLVPLRAAAFAPGASGYALWTPERGTVTVTASGLPAADEDLTYRVRVLLGDLSTVWAHGLTVDDRGRLTATVALPDRRWRVVKIELYRDPPGILTLAARLPRP